MKVLVVGGGGREHALCWTLARSPQVRALFAAPGNAGTASVAKNLDIPATDIAELLRFARREAVDLTVVGPEQPLIDGIADAFHEEKLKLFGPSRAAARLEGSKAFCKQFLRKHGIPTASFRVFDEPRAAIDYARTLPYPVVVKADGPAAGKGVVIASREEEAVAAIRQMMVERVFGASGARVVIEEHLTGQEASVMAICDGNDLLLLENAQDHKKIFQGEIGPNTGGMGAFSPVPSLSRADQDRVVRKVLVPVIHAMRREGAPFKGVLYAGMMFTRSGPKVLEFNVRFGDPEAQVVLARLKSDLAPILLAAISGRLGSLEPDQVAWSERSSVCVVISSGGYPGSYETGFEISGLEEASSVPDVTVFHAGTAARGRNTVTSGGRVLGVTAMGDTVRQAREQAYRAVEKISFKNSYFRPDIAGVSKPEAARRESP
jgi:phosphoribosylamine--glycine ligase